jgi:hypothetical protein
VASKEILLNTAALDAIVVELVSERGKKKGQRKRETRVIQKKRDANISGQFVACLSLCV